MVWADLWYDTFLWWMWCCTVHHDFKVLLFMRCFMLLSISLMWKSIWRSMVCWCQWMTDVYRGGGALSSGRSVVCNTNDLHCPLWAITGTSHHVFTILQFRQWHQPSFLQPVQPLVSMPVCLLYPPISLSMPAWSHHCLVLLAPL